MAVPARTRREVLRKELLLTLQQDCSQPNVALAKALNIDSSNVSRIRAELERSGHIKAYKAILNSSTLGLKTLAFVEVALRQASALADTENLLLAMPQIQEMHRIQGEFDILLKIRVPSNESLSEFIEQRLATNANVKATRTVIAMYTKKETSDVSLDSATLFSGLAAAYPALRRSRRQRRGRRKSTD